MQNIASAIRDTISISLFNRGLAGEIFEEVKKSGAKVVMKNNTAERMEKYDSSATLSEEEMDARLGICPGDLEDYEEVEIE